MIQNPENNEASSITEAYSPRYRRYSSLKKEAPKLNPKPSHKLILKLIDSLGDLFSKRMQVHENELLTVVKMELHRAL